jgi:hypothetical protein
MIFDDDGGLSVPERGLSGPEIAKALWEWLAQKNIEQERAAYNAGVEPSIPITNEFANYACVSL